MSVVHIAGKYLEAGYSPIPLVPGKKYPSLKAWQKHGETALAPEEVPSLFAGTDSIGLAMGFGGLEALDIDSKHFTGGEMQALGAYVNEKEPELLEKLTI